MSTSTLDLIEAYVTSNRLPSDAANALSVLCRNLIVNERNWDEPNAGQIIKNVEEETLRLIKYYEKYHTEPSTRSFNRACHNALLEWKIHNYINLVSSSTSKTPNLFWYQKLIFGLIIVATCIVCAVIGMTIGIAIGATIGGGVGSAAPALGTAFGGIVGAFGGGIVGAIKGLSIGAGLGAAIGFAVLGASGIIAGWFIGRRVLPKKTNRA